jgi:2'-5' RNA ligase/phage portal protein BeeE
MSTNPILFAGEDKSVSASIKASIQSWLEQARPDISTSDLSTLLRTSVAAHRAGNLRSKVISRVEFKAKTADGTYLDRTHPLMQIIHQGKRNRLERSELTHFGWGRNLVYKERSPISDAVMNLRWMNPHDWAAEVSVWGGLKHFNVFTTTSRRNREPSRTIELQDAIYSHYIDFRDDFDGVSPLEVAFMHATLDSAIAEMGVSLFRNMAVPLGMVVPDVEATAKAGIVKASAPPDEVNKITDFFRRTVQGIRNVGRVIVAPHGWKFVQLQMDLDKVAMKDTSESAERHVFSAADIPYEIVAPSASNYAQAYVAVKSWFELWIKPTAEWYAEIYTEQLVNEYKVDVVLEPDYSRLEFLKEDSQVKTTYITGRVSAGVMDLYTAQKELDQQPDERLKGYYMLGGVPVHINDIPTYWREKGAGGGTAVPPLGMNDAGGLGGQQLPATQPAAAPAALPEPPAPATSFRASDGTPSGCVLFSVADQPSVKAVQDLLRIKVGGAEPVRWTPAHQFHVTLAYASLVDETPFRAVYDLVKDDLTALVVKAGPVDVFEQDDQNVLILKVQATDALKAFQRQVVEAFEAQGVKLSDYSQPDDWNPHITLAYLGKDVPVPTFNETVELPLTGLIFSRTGYEFEHIVVASDGVTAKTLHNWIPDPVVKDFQRWRDVAARKGADYTFESETIPADTASYLRLILQEAPTDEHLADAFIRARKHYIRHHGKGIRAYGDTATRYRSVLYDLINSAMESRIDRKAFGDLGRVEITTAFRAGFRDGLVEGGVNTDRLDEDEERDLQLEIKAERGHWTSLANEIYRKVLKLRDQARDLSNQAKQARDPETKDRLQREALAKYGEFLLKKEDIVQRIDLWVNKGLARVHEQGKLSAKANQMMKWHLGRTEEHCRTCGVAAGQVHRAKDWKRRGVLPKTDALDCGGWRCDCSLDPTDEPARGRLDRIPLFVGKHDHDHDEDVEIVDSEQADAEAEEMELELSGDPG